jgi:TrmH family RNA methyltransferase
VSTPASRESLRVIEDVRRIATAKGRARVGAFLVEGRRMLGRALRAGWAPRHVLVGAGLRREQPDLESALAEVTALGGHLHEVADADLLALSEGRRSGLLAALCPLPDSPPLGAWLVARRTEPDRNDTTQGARVPPDVRLDAHDAVAVYLVMVDVVEPGNVGALIRTGLASGAAGAICVGSTDPFHPKAVRTSLGGLFKLPLVRLANSVGLVETLRERHIHTLATVARDGAPLDRAIWPPGSLAILVGNEGEGLPDRLRDASDGRVTIDLSTAADSYCVNAAAAVCLYEVQRRRRFALDFEG